MKKVYWPHEEIEVLKKQSFFYKNLLIEMRDTLRATNSSLIGTVLREWKIDRNAAFTIAIDRKTYLAYRNKNRERIILRDFDPNLDFHLSMDEKKAYEVNAAAHGLSFQQEIVDTEF